MTIRKKIFLLAGILLALFGAVVGTLALIKKLNSSELSHIVGYELPLSKLVSEFDVDTDRYELSILRVLQLESPSPEAIAAAISATRALADELRATVMAAIALLDRATQDSRYQIEDRLALARVEGSFKYLSRDLDDFLSLGTRTMDALADGHRQDARTVSLGFDKFAKAFGPDLSEIRRNIADLIDRSMRDVLFRDNLHTYFSFALFLAACGLGLGISAVGSTRVVSGLRQLVASTRIIESGTELKPVSILTRDEVGELARSFNRMIQELQARERIKDTFGKFIDPRIVTRLISSSGIDQAERRTLTVFFSDINGFVGISEQLTAGAVVNLLNSYFGIVAKVIHAHNGVIDKYIGDAVMAFWIPPFSAGDDHATDACLAALAQHAAITEFCAKLTEITGMRRNPPKLAVRMGIATGEAVVGTIGSESARSYTVIGDTVNLASRLEGLAKVYGSSIIVSEETHRLVQHLIETRELDLVTVSGKTEPVRIYELISRIGELGKEQNEFREVFADGLVAYRQREWDKAEGQFEKCLRAAPDDRPSHLFLERIALFRSAPPQADWDGVWRHSEK